MSSEELIWTLEEVLFKVPSPDGKKLFASQAALARRISANSASGYSLTSAASMLSQFVGGKSTCPERLHGAILTAARERLDAQPVEAVERWVERVTLAIDEQNRQNSIVRDKLVLDWREIERQERDPRTTEVWIFSRGAFMEGWQPAVLDAVSQLANKRTKRYFFVCPRDARGANDAMAYLYGEFNRSISGERQSLADENDCGKIVGVIVENPEDIHLFPDNLQFLIHARLNRTHQAYVALEVPTSRPSTSDPIANIGWFRMSDQIAREWYISYCSRIQLALARFEEANSSCLLQEPMRCYTYPSFRMIDPISGEIIAQETVNNPSPTPDHERQGHG